ncbi:hypothetical protein CRD09_00120 [Corynebacterium sp. LK22]|nr:hypothetical protein [Corynebacterium sp. LK22]MBC6831036.1 hypothetical protein [Corynebacterium sp. LK29]
MVSVGRSLHYPLLDISVGDLIETHLTKHRFKILLQQPPIILSCFLCNGVHRQPLSRIVTEIRR